MKILLIGGSKSGKSHLGQDLARTAGRPMIYWATMQPLDSEDEDRIAAHLLDREGWGFTTIECGRALESAFDRVPKDSAVLLDSVTVLLANEMFSENIDEQAGARTAQSLLALGEHVHTLVCVCDELWREEEAYGEGTVLFRRQLAEVCRKLVEEFDVVCEVVAGILHVWKGELP